MSQSQRESPHHSSYYCVDYVLGYYCVDYVLGYYYVDYVVGQQADSMATSVLREQVTYV